MLSYNKKQIKKHVRVLATGVFDLLHPGHVFYLEESKKLGTELVVLVTNDMVVTRTKGTPLFNAKSRQHMVAALRCVDEAIVPTNTDPKLYFQTVLDIMPDVITLGYDQTFSERELSKELESRGWKGEVVRIGKYPSGDISSSKLKEAIKGEISN